MSTSEIYHFLPVNEQLATSGQPTEAQLQVAAAEGFRTIINLATIDSRSLPDEAESVQALGMTYYHLPVDWADPKDSDFDAFSQLMDELPPGKTLIHCAANFRVTAFYGLYAQHALGWSSEQAEAFRATIWQGSDYPIWEHFIARTRQRFST